MAALGLVATGCVYIPTPAHDLLAGRGMIEKSRTADLQPGTSTREEILLRFGEPDATLRRQRVFVYRWTRIQGYLIVAGGNSGDVFPVGKTTLLLFQFDDAGRLERYAFTGVGLSPSIPQRAEQWAAGPR